MKKFYLFLVAAAAMTLSVQAQQLSAQIDLGGYEDIDDNSDMYNGGALDDAPVNFYLNNSAAQMIYKAEDLADMFDGKVNPKITKLSYKFYNMGAFQAYPRFIKVYAQEIEEGAFAKDEDGDFNYFDFDESDLVAQFDYEEDFMDYFYEVGELVIDLANSPISVTEGKNLLITIVAEGDEATDSGEDVTFFVDNSRSKRVMAFGNDRITFDDFVMSDDFPKATTTLSSATNMSLPVTLIDYIYEEEAQPQDYYLTGAFNNWGQNGNENIKFEANEDGDLAASVELPDGNNDGENGFKVISYAEDGSTVWYGGEDANNAHFFKVDEGLLGAELSLYPGNDYVNLIVEKGGKYNLILKEASASAASGAPAKAPAAGLKLIVTKAEELPTAVTDLTVENIASVQYVNLAGQVSAAPFKGVNIMVTTMKDGSKKAVKVVK
ncbi:MAG: hypothetical protein IJ632_05750 [Muribaculaceae bacterium]|nr:hypothetical protein [Muribaculaceae bacterium]